MVNVDDNTNRRSLSFLHSLGSLACNDYPWRGFLSGYNKADFVLFYGICIALEFLGFQWGSASSHGFLL
jgi:hypothetical protein